MTVETAVVYLVIATVALVVDYIVNLRQSNHD